MIAVKFFGLMSVDNNIRKIEVKEGSIKQVIAEVMSLYPGITEKQLKQSIMIVNNKRVNGRKRLSIELQDKDELVFLNPPSGG
ncbi:MAG: MoaD/ThiS family protein [Eubacteriales bacterium]